MSRLRLILATVGLVAVASLVHVRTGWNQASAEISMPAPPFPTSPDHWIGTPASWKALRGKVVVLDVWTFG